VTEESRWFFDWKKENNQPCAFVLIALLVCSLLASAPLWLAYWLMVSLIFCCGWLVLVLLRSGGQLINILYSHTKKQGGPAVLLLRGECEAATRQELCILT